MKRSHIALVLAFLITSLVAIVFLQRKPSSATEETIIEEISSTPAPRVTTTPAVVEKTFAPRPNNKVTSEIPTRCMSSIYALYEHKAETKLTDLIEDTTSNCPINTDVAGASDALKTCKTKEECDLAFAVLRTLMVDNIAKKIPIKDIDDPVLLLERLQLRYDFSAASRAENVELAKRLIELEPDYYPAYKFLAVNDYYGIREATTPEEQEKHWQDFWQTAQSMQDKGNETDKNNRLEVEVLTIHARAPAADQMQDMLTKMQQAHPEAAILSFYQGMVAYKSGDLDAAKKWFADAKTKDRNNDHRFQQAIDMAEGKAVDPQHLGPQIRVDW